MTRWHTRKGDIVALGPDTHQKVVMDGVVEVGRYFILYEVKEVGSIPIGRVQTTQLVVPLNLHPSVLLHFLALILMAFFPCFF
jgi:predicted transcriptional regulator